MKLNQQFKSPQRHGDAKKNKQKTRDPRSFALTSRVKGN